MPKAQQLYGGDASILITGASSGIGAAIAEHVAAYGGRIALMARRAERLAEVSSVVRAAGGVPLEVTGDVSDPESVAAAHERIEAEQGPVDVAILNAGIGLVAPLRKFDAREVKRVFDVNIMGVVYWLDRLLPSMLERRAGVLVGVSSLAAHGPLAGAGPYAASKAALSSLLGSLRLEATDQGIQISVVEPGFVRSEMTAKNKFPMPFLVEAADAAKTICDGVAAGQGYIRFPWQMAAAVQVMSHLPTSLLEHLGPMMRGKKRGKSQRA